MWVRVWEAWVTGSPFKVVLGAVGEAGLARSARGGAGGFTCRAIIVVRAVCFGRAY
jgi:hypothetical protein